MKQIVMLSGKGGTGKTSITASLARVATEPKVIVDADVDAANMAILLPGDDEQWRPFFAGTRAVIDYEACINCLTCVWECPFKAIRESKDFRPVVDEFDCEGCGVCSQVCPTNAFSFKPHQAGTWTVRDTKWGPLVHAALNVGEDNSGKLVAQVRQEGRAQAAKTGADYVLIDGPPGIGCPVHAALGGTDLVIAVTEPGVSAQHDLNRLLDLAGWFKIPAAIILNKADLDPKAAQNLLKTAEDKGAKIVAKIPFMPEVPMALSKGIPLIEVPGMQEILENCWQEIKELV